VLSYCLVSSLFTPRVRILRKGRRYILGRDRRADFSLPSEVVSRQHAEIVWKQDGFEIKDLGSKNGTKVNGEAVDRRVLKDGDQLWLGPFNLVYREYSGDISGLIAEADSGDATVSMSKNVLTEGSAFVLGGRFSGSELLEICQLLGLNEKDGVLRVTAGEHRGILAFQKGQVIRAQLDERTGEPAALLLLESRSGTFEFVTGDPGNEEFRAPADALIMEAARRVDEGQDTLQVGGSGEPPAARDETRLYERP
jgi:pSer/pThr/pTyr-binding forkhead associated (FHA) protein